MIKYIYRVENKNGEGCYANGNMFYNELEHHENKEHPSPFKDKGINRVMESEERCGFLNLNQVITWFNNKELMKLRNNGFILKRIKANITAIGEYQILFTRI